MPAGGGEIPGGPGVLGQVGQGVGELDEIVAVAEAPGRRRQVLTGRRGVPGGQGQTAQQPVTPGHVFVPAIPSADFGVAVGQCPGRAGPPGAGQPFRPQGAAQRVQVITVRIVGDLDLVGGAELAPRLGSIAAETRQPPQERMSDAI